MKAKLLVLALACLASAVVNGQSLFVDPDCPAPTDAITLIAVERGQYSVSPTPLSVTVAGSVIKLVGSRSQNIFGIPPSAVRATIPPLPIGAYRFEYYAKAGMNPEEFVGAKDFVVQANPPTCGARYVQIAGSYFAATAVNSPFSTPLVARVTDAHGNGVAGATVYFQRLQRPEESVFFWLHQWPDFSTHSDSSVSGDQGYVTLDVAANGLPGAYQYKAYIAYPDSRSTAAFFTFANRPDSASIPVVPVVEYEDGLRIHFFMTANPDEMSKLDGTYPWRRTGGVFLAFPSSATGIPGVNPVCRFYGLPEAGLDSHFFSAFPNECQDVQQRFGGAWLLETDDAFGVFLPDTATGACPGASRPVSRAYNNRADANHRYALSLFVLLSTEYFTVSGPWILEGFGPESAVMCVPD